MEDSKTKAPKAKPKTPRDLVIEQLQLTGIFNEDSLTKTPKKWERVGSIIIVKRAHLSEWTIEQQSTFGNALLKSIGPLVHTVVIDEHGVQGELRQPSEITILARDDQNSVNDPLETIHIENGVKYKLNVGKVMFASGNGTERMHFGMNVPFLPGDLAVDMFAGIGYFTLPLALSYKHYVKKLEKEFKSKSTEKKQTFHPPESPPTLISLEKNPDSFHYLNQNININNVTDIVKLFLGDNRIIGTEYLGKANRVMMGYLPTPKEFLQRAFDFLNMNQSNDKWIHYHYLSAKDEIKSIIEKHFDEELSIWNKRSSNDVMFEVSAIRTVKSYAPKVLHCVADVRIFNK